MTITLHWWTLPSVLTALYFLWGVIPSQSKTVWDDFQAFFVSIFGLIGVLLSWTIAAVFFRP